ncbi:nitroreductase [Limosilactobacillus fermentum]|uniref:nitroreductase n=1 Tax=Limosilactobacillus fermentum TaxID=1613 RepID=UPI0021A56E8F|nr:nitroreductase [Limosilactobacillus fermentum]MCT2871080.1 nitroreductase [Limosilactobacillus fermentum]
MQVEDAIKARHAVRDFTDQPVAKETIQEIVRLAQQTPSWVNSEPWRVYAATGQSLTQIRQGCLDLAAQKVATSPDLKTMSRDDWDPRPQKLMKDWGHDLVHSFADFDEAHTVMTGASDALNNAPAILFVTIPKQTPDWAILDAGAFMQSLLLAATAKGLGSIPTYNSVRYPQVVRQALGIPEAERLLVGVELGYESPAKVNAFRAQRPDLSDVLKISE